MTMRAKWLEAPWRGRPYIGDPLVNGATIPLMGLGAPGTREGDMACVFLGCSAPVVIRPDVHHYSFVWPAYVNNIANGEAITNSENGLYDLETFELC